MAGDPPPEAPTTGASKGKCSVSVFYQHQFLMCSLRSEILPDAPVIDDTEGTYHSVNLCDSYIYEVDMHFRRRIPTPGFHPTTSASFLSPVPTCLLASVCSRRDIPASERSSQDINVQLHSTLR